MRWARRPIELALAAAAAATARPGLAVEPGAAAAPHAPWALSEIHIVDLQSGTILRDRTIVIEGDRIRSIHPDTPRLGRHVRIVSGGGSFLIPGLWDMHVHIADERYLSLFVAHGIIGVRDMGGGLDVAEDGCESLNASILNAWRSEISAGARVGPELVISGPPASGTGWPTSLAVTSPAEARAAIATLAGAQVDFVKIYDRIPPAAYLALADAARAAGLPFAGHLVEEVGALDSIRAGQRSFEHIRASLLLCFTADPVELERFFVADGWNSEDRRWGRQVHSQCPQVIAALRQQAVWLTPTLVVEKAKIAVEDPEHVADRRRRYLPASVQSGFARFVRRKLDQGPSERASERLWWQTQQRFVARMQTEGVRWLAGTDTACEGGMPGSSLHQELREMVAAGLTPLEALRSATVEPARYFNRPLDGEVQAGARADLVLLEANPLVSIDNIERIRGLVLDGRFISRTELDRKS